MASFIAAGTALMNYGQPMIPFYTYYSMFGMQRVGDLVWAGADSRTRGFLVGGTAGRTTLAGEGLQHQDGHSHLLASAVPNLCSYDPAFAYEIAVIVQEGIRRMFEQDEEIWYYLTVGNENYRQPPMPTDPRGAQGNRQRPLQILGFAAAGRAAAGEPNRQRLPAQRSHHRPGRTCRPV